MAKAIGRNSKPSIINIDKSGPNKKGILRYNFLKRKRIKIRVLSQIEITTKYCYSLPFSGSQEVSHVEN